SSSKYSHRTTFYREQACAPAGPFARSAAPAGLPPALPETRHMSQATADTFSEASQPYAHARGNVARLTIAQALAGANSVVVYATGAIVGNLLAPDPALATLPISIFVVGMAACTLPAGAIAQRHGRRAAFLAGT